MQDGKRAADDDQALPTQPSHGEGTHEATDAMTAAVPIVQGQSEAAPNAAAATQPPPPPVPSKAQLAESMAAIEAMVVDAHTASWDAALALSSSGAPVDVKTLSVHEIRCCRACNQGRLAALLGRLSRGLWALTSAEGLSSKGAAGRIQLRSLLRLMGVLLPLLSEEHQDMGVRQMLWAELQSSPVEGSPSGEEREREEDESVASSLASLPRSLGGCLVGATLRAFFLPGFTTLEGQAADGATSTWSTSTAEIDEARQEVMHAALGVCLATLFVPVDALAVSPNRTLIELANAPEQQARALFRALLSVIFSDRKSVV